MFMDYLSQKDYVETGFVQKLLSANASPKGKKRRPGIFN